MIIAITTGMLSNVKHQLCVALGHTVEKQILRHASDDNMIVKAAE
jgi:hypothetical protein